jgi:hypothetical protein
MNTRREEMALDLMDLLPRPMDTRSLEEARLKFNAANAFLVKYGHGCCGECKRWVEHEDGAEWGYCAEFECCIETHRATDFCSHWKEKP